MLEPWALEFGMVIEMVKTHKSPGTDPSTVELIREGSRTIRCETHKLTNSVWSKEELPVVWKESITRPIYRRVIKQIIVITGRYHVCQPCTNFYRTFAVKFICMCRECY